MSVFILLLHAQQQSFGVTRATECDLRRSWRWRRKCKKYITKKEGVWIINKGKEIVNHSKQGPSWTHTFRRFAKTLVVKNRKPKDEDFCLSSSMKVKEKREKRKEFFNKDCTIALILSFAFQFTNDLY